MGTADFTRIASTVWLVCSELLNLHNRSDVSKQSSYDLNVASRCLSKQSWFGAKQKDRFVHIIIDGSFNMTSTLLGSTTRNKGVQTDCGRG